mmetsp:Transcript_16256/g.49082  ORF Transcript_16256/g.49082 Transcript_16256/m.49082 type:complete len:201 (-) Transcript_16256:74-676(-)
MRTLCSRLCLKEANVPATWAAPATATAMYLHLPLSHLSNSAPQFLTREAGHTTRAFRHAGLPRWPPCVRSVQTTATDWSVFPSPMSSARMQPQPLKPFRPMRQSKRNWTPIRWCSRRTRETSASATTWRLPSGSWAGGVQSTSRMPAASSSLPVSRVFASCGGDSLKSFTLGILPGARVRRAPNVLPCSPDVAAPGMGER